MTNVKLTITDYTGSLFCGSPIICIANKFTMNGKNILGYKPNTMKDNSINSDDNSYLGSNWDRRKGRVTFQGYENPIIDISGNWVGSRETGDGIGSELVNRATGEELGSPVLTPYRLIKFAMTPGTYYINEDRMIGTLINEAGVGSSLYNSSGIPCVVDDWNIDFDANTDDIIAWNMRFREDKIYDID